jgi:hypothetical protein
MRLHSAARTRDWTGREDAGREALRLLAMQVTGYRPSWLAARVRRACGLQQLLCSALLAHTQHETARIEGEGEGDVAVAVGTHSSGHVQQATVCATRSGQRWSAERERGRQRFGRHVVQHWAGHHSATKTPWALEPWGWGADARDSWSPLAHLPTSHRTIAASTRQGQWGAAQRQDKGRRKAGVAVRSERNTTCTNSRSSGLVWVWVWLLCAALRCSGTGTGSGSLGGWSYFGAQQTCGPDYNP